MRDPLWDVPQLNRRQRDRYRSRGFVAAESRDEDEETELAFHRVWLARELQSRPAPPNHHVDLPVNAAANVVQDIARLRSACGINPLPQRHPS